MGGKGSVRWGLPLAVVSALALLLVSAGPAVADHAYSHRYIVVGRVLDALGDPVRNVSASATFTGLETEGACTQAPLPQPTTDGWGDYFLCYHIHSFSPAAQVHVTIEGAVYHAAADTDLRITVQNVQLSTAKPAAQKDASVLAQFDTTYTVRGRVWRPAPATVVETIPVNGVTLNHADVHITFSPSGGSTVEGHAVTDGYGDYAARLPLAAALSSGSIQVAVEGTVAPAAANPAFMGSFVKVILPPLNPVLQALQTWWPLFVGIGVVAVAGVLMFKYRPQGARRPRDVSKVPGIGRSKAVALRNAGYPTIERLAAASPSQVAESTSITTKEAKRLIRKARELVEAPETSDA